MGRVGGALALGVAALPVLSSALPPQVVQKRDPSERKMLHVLQRGGMTTNGIEWKGLNGESELQLAVGVPQDSERTCTV